MKCGYSEELIALYLEGDLPDFRALQVEQHLGTCRSCRETAADLQESLALFKGLRRYGVQASDLSDVRQRVRNEVKSVETSPGLALQIERAMFIGLRRKYALAGLAAAGIVFILGGAAIW